MPATPKLDRPETMEEAVERLKRRKPMTAAQRRQLAALPELAADRHLEAS